MFSNVSWSSYLTTVALFVLAWYSYLIFRYYRKNVQDLFKKKIKSPYRKEEFSSGPFFEFKESFSTTEDAEELYNKILTVFTESDAGGLSKVAFKNYIRFILLEYPFVKQSALRGKINSLAVLESTKYPELLLTSAEMDSLWEEEN